MNSATTEQLLERLIREVRISGAADRFIDAQGVADLLDLSYTYVRDKVTKHPSFPKPLKVTEDGHPRWLRSDVLRWGKARAENG